ncbi:MAG: T9SS type A sorting domain-containing protein [Cryomorphaceae bacterium]|nr:T9SS type A sorting domain-containing protein [Cryomorphaceae bacterium]
MNKNYARALRFVKQMRIELEHLLKNPSTNEVKIRSLINKIKCTILRLRRRFHKAQIRHALGGLAILFGLTNAPEIAAQTFAPGVTNPFGLTPTSYLNLPSLVDIDGDGDLDMVSVEDYGVINFFQNTGSATNPQFAAPSFPAWIPDTVLIDLAFGDLDGDGDYDIMGVSYYGDVYYYENTGSATNPQFATGISNPFNINSGIITTGSPTLIDMDGDGDLDLFISDYYGGILYYENTGSASAPNFSTAAVANPFNIPVSSVFRIATFADLDGDGDADLLTCELYGDVKYYENTGSATNPQFGTEQNNPFGFTGMNTISKFTAGDIDDDGDLDLFMGVDGFYSANYNANTIFFENTSPTNSTEAFRKIRLTVSPNPTTDMVHIETDAHVKAVRITNMDGKVIRETTHKDVSLGDLPAGVYFLSIVDENNAERRERVIKQ